VVDGLTLALRNAGEDGIGEVCVRGRCLMRGYLDAPELTAETIVDGWLHTGDLGVIDASGHLKLVGRAKNMIVTEGGKNVYPEDVEAAFVHVDCEELCVMPSRAIWPGRSSAEQLVVVVRPRKEQARGPLIDAIASANRALAEYKRAAQYVVCDRELPRTASLKIKRDALAKLLRDTDLEPEPLTHGGRA
jgi:long-chain acyl-CoA synthetase